MNAVAIRERQVTLLDVLDRLLDTGAVVAGDLTLSVAEVDLIFASLRLVISSTDRIRSSLGAPAPGLVFPPVSGTGSGQDPAGCTSLHGPATASGWPGLAGGPPAPGQGGTSPPAPCQLFGAKRDGAGLDPERLASSLAQLVVTLAELLRKLLEREAMRRVERGTLTPGEADRLGQAFMRLEEKMAEIKQAFGLKDEDVNLNLGPLGKLL
ncbi:MAG: gas vesicle protein K [Chloroflexi bacterium]|nr:gas vesicle protein K [Chloroflexota bacterium]